MDNLIIEACPTTPEVKFEADNGIFYISGKSYPENVHDFYDPLFDYLKQYIKNPQPTTEFAFRWQYYNSATSQIIVRLIMMLEESCSNFVVKWYCSEDFELMSEKGFELKETLEINLDIIDN